jgi:hypothetical protein
MKLTVIFLIASLLRFAASSAKTEIISIKGSRNGSVRPRRRLLIINPSDCGRHMHRRIGKKLLSWDESITDELEFRLSERQDALELGRMSQADAKSASQIEDEIYADQDFWQFRWHDLTDLLTQILKRKNPEGLWKAEVRNFGWMDLEGCKIFEAGDGRTFLREILPNADCHFHW